ncbi:MAG: hypothetical protein ACRDY0_04405 [Acidimicrobiales bacterium]
MYPTLVRSRGTGLAAGASKLGGFLGLCLAAGAVTPPGIVEAAMVAAVPTALSAAAIAGFGLETHHRPLEDVSAPSRPFPAPCPDKQP